ncbi:hypothetical protein H2201_008017 [Coniosporium apollinis]|uniref:Apple domain-containing protein n=1 Tax=Coniosporium apollinis TaxID=61459 RepID=A0ABQ9NJY2_9PEZI|nr:hypothetical protein H2201_008017 [Coniosporium apollinis]
MRAGILLPAVVGLASAAALKRRQEIDYNGVVAAADPVVSIASGVQHQSVAYDPSAAVLSAMAEVTAHPLPVGVDTVAPVEKRNLHVAARAACQPEPTIANTYTSMCQVPRLFRPIRRDAKASVHANGYLGYDVVEVYDPSVCAAKCNSKVGCIGFNIFFERDPTLDPGVTCENPPAFTNVKCTYWGGPTSPETAVNKGQTRSKFEVVIAGSNGYTTLKSQSVSGYTQTFLDNAAINGPNSCNGKNTYMGYKLFNSGPFSADRCKAACEAQSAYNQRHPPQTGKPQICRFFNTYILNRNGISQGQYCSLYSEPWAASYAKNKGQTRADGVYTIAYSFTFSSEADPGHPICPSDISYLQSNAAEFCTAYIGYSEPVVTQMVTQTPAASSVYETVNVVTTTTEFKTETVNEVVASSPPLRRLNRTEMVEAVAVTEAAVATGVLQRRTSLPLATPNAVQSWAPASISAACSAVPTGTSIATVTETAATPLTTIIRKVLSTEAVTSVVTETLTSTTATQPEPTSFRVRVNTGNEPRYLYTKDRTGTYLYLDTTDPSKATQFTLSADGYLTNGDLYSMTAAANRGGPVVLNPKANVDQSVGNTHAQIHFTLHADRPLIIRMITVNDSVQALKDVGFYLCPTIPLPVLSFGIESPPRTGCKLVTVTAF